MASILPGCSEDSAPCNKTGCEQLVFSCWLVAHGGSYQSKSLGLTQGRADRLPLADIVAESTPNGLSLNFARTPTPIAPKTAVIAAIHLKSHSVLNL